MRLGRKVHTILFNFREILEQAKLIYSDRNQWLHETNVYSIDNKSGWTFFREVEIFHFLIVVVDKRIDTKDKIHSSVHSQFQ